MLPWLVALAAGLLAGGLQYGARLPRAAALPAALLRCAAVALLVALLLDAPAGRARRARPLVALDASASWRRAGGTGWRAALDSARAAGGDTLLLFGDSVRAAPRGAGDRPPTDVASRIAPVAERAAAAGRPVVVVTDGELDDLDAAGTLPAGSRVVVLPHATARDAGLVSLDLPRAAVSGDTLLAQLSVVAGAAGVPGGELALEVAGKPVATARLEPLAAWGERTVTLRGVLAAADGPALARAMLRVAGDVEPRNDTLIAAIDVSRAAGAVFVSTRPDVDAREGLAVLRGALAVPARAYWQVAPGQWRADGTLAPVTEAEVRRALREAPAAVLHGDTAALGAPRGAAGGALALIVPAASEEGEWYASAAPPSPLSAALSGLPWDSLPPIQAGAPPKGEWTGLEARLGRTGTPRAIVAGVETPRRVAVVAASGLWRWRLRGGASADAFTAFWGALFDWLLAGRRDVRLAVPEAVSVREGEPVRWRRGAGDDSVVRVAIVPRAQSDAPAGGDTVTLRFASGTTVAESAPLAAGVYDVAVGAGRAVLAVNPSREWLPRSPRAGARSLRGLAPAERAPGLRRFGWAYGAVVLFLCIEWVLRRRSGMR